MRQRTGQWMSWAALVVLAVGCQRAGRFGAAPAAKDEPRADTSSPAPGKLKPLPANYAWMLPDAKGRQEIKPAVPIRFVAHGGERWEKLKQFWTESSKPATPLGKARREVLIKVPLGLDDPTPYIPRSNPPTVAKWELGKRLFFDEGYLWPPRYANTSCATCHRPDHGFTDGAFAGQFKKKVPTLINCVYNLYLFWDGRASALEEVVQRTPDDEREPPTLEAEEGQRANERRHVWSGVVRRLRENPAYVKQFREVFGTLPTQDNVGKALATYLRTILAGDSLFDRARLAAGGKLPGQRHYQGLLGDQAVLKAVDPEGTDAARVAQTLAMGQEIFRTKGRCARCHRGPNFTENDFWHLRGRQIVFHNVGLWSLDNPPRPEQYGRFAVAPVGLKDRRLIGAYKTPTLRCLPQTGPYFHDGSQGQGRDHPLFQAVAAHVKPTFTAYLDPELRGLVLTEHEVRALEMFLHALNGDVDGKVRSR